MTPTTSQRSNWPRTALAFVASLVLAAVWGSLAQTWFNLEALTAFVEIPAGLRLKVSLQDLLGFAPLFAVMVLVAWLPAFAVAGWLSRRWPAARTPLYAVAAGAGLTMAIRAADAVAPMPVLIDATRGTTGLLAVVTGSVIGGVLFALWTRSSRRPGTSI